MQFIRQKFSPGFNHYNVRKLLGDASARQYYRYVTDSGTSYILAAYPEPFDPKDFAYRQIYDLLQEIEVPVPEILGIDGKLGIVLQQDLGDESLQRTLIKADEKQKKLLLKDAIGLIIRIQEKGTSVFKPEYEGFNLAFDEEKLRWELNFFHRHYLKNYRKLNVLDENKLSDEFSRLAVELAGYPRVLCHRDFHVRNMMVDNGILYVIDFQDARWGPPSYDLSSLLKDSLELDLDIIEELLEFYLNKVRKSPTLSTLDKFESKSFRRQFNLMCIQRLLKALGTYAYQIIVRENFIYEQYMAGSLHRARLSLDAVPEFPIIRGFVENELKARGFR
jgi:aminoglycoside/choline kinase family phosphotransferase